MPHNATRLSAWFTALCVLGAYAVNADDSEIDRAIAKHRMGTLTVHATPGAEVTVAQLRHEFWFGAAISNGPFGRRADPVLAGKYKEVFLENFNAAVTENALKWHVMERTQGDVDYSIVDAILAWTEEHDIPLRGHNIFWGVANRVPDWQKELDDGQLQNVLKSRAITIGQRYRGRFAEYDLNNEMLHNNYYEQRLGSEITKQMAMWVKEGDADAVLYLNDYDILTGNKLDDYVTHIETLLKQGVPLGGIGVQGHLHGDSFDRDALKRALDTLAQFRSADSRHRIQLPRSAIAFLRKPPSSAHTRGGRGEGRGDRGLLPNLLCSSCRRGDSHVGILGRCQLDPCVVLVQA